MFFDPEFEFSSIFRKIRIALMSKLTALMSNLRF